MVAVFIHIYLDLPVTIKSLQASLMEKEIYGGSTTSLGRLLKTIVFFYKKDDNRRALMELPHIAHLRRNFLQRYFFFVTYNLVN